MALSGVVVLELAGLAPAPFCGKILADFGATVIRVDRSLAPTLDTLSEGKQSIVVNMKQPKGVATIMDLISKADVLLEPFRPGVMERLGCGPREALKVNPRLIYARLNGFGNKGSYAKRAGHDINFVAMSGLLSTMMRANGVPTTPGNILCDFAGGGLMCALGIVLALFERASSGKGQVVNTSMAEGLLYLGTYLSKAIKTPLWNGPPGTNLLDTGAPFYDCYKTKDGRWISLGALEPRFFNNFVTAMKEHAGMPEPPQQFDRDQWQKMRKLFQEAFSTKTMMEWDSIFEHIDACVAPALTLDELATHSHTKEANMMKNGVPVPQPRLSRTPGCTGDNMPLCGQHTRQVLEKLKFSKQRIDQLLKEGIISQIPSSKL